jgi:hypothetical protein
MDSYIEKGALGAQLGVTVSRCEESKSQPLWSVGWPKVKHCLNYGHAFLPIAGIVVVNAEEEVESKLPF